ncbi:hypothetical protein HYFRA_00004605 [Hymenoscyphus fraxineus]|uniref:Uncharacterized protein n=1 Tax=Hymenoscyphus fraxineus TaxID=746836 RepID=A0A9N9PTM6_9HELO|nr:hypothetical protein HYFRA_00004605 [Hymenoscyphus fraxineus]
MSPPTTQPPTTQPPQQQTAQIPLQSFTLPTFPPETLTNPQTTHLTLTSDIPLSSYTSLLTQPFTIPPLPRSITTLTLESFSLGYPPSFLPLLASNLPRLKSLVFFEQVLGGTDEEKGDVINFLTQLSEVREVHFLDVLMGKGVMRRVSGALGGRVEFVGVSYTYRGEQVDLLPEIGEFEGWVREGVRGLRIAMVATPPEPDPEEEGREREDVEKEEMGILPPRIADTAMSSLVDKILALETLILLDLTLFPLPLSSLLAILTSCKKIKVLSVTLVLETSWEHVFERLRGNTGGVESLEIVGYPGNAEVVEGLKKSGEGGEGWLKENWLMELEGVEGVSVSVLRTRGEEWRKEKERWVKV